MCARAADVITNEERVFTAVLSACPRDNTQPTRSADTGVRRRRVVTATPPGEVRRAAGLSPLAASADFCLCRLSWLSCAAMDTVADAMAAAHTDTASKGIPFAAGGHGIDSLHEEIALTLLPSLLLFGGSAVGIGLTVYFFINLSDCQEDLINPYTLCERVNGKLHWELAAHAAAVAALLLEELVDGDRLHWIALILATPGLALRIVWYRGKKLEIDATNVFNPRFTGRLKTRWGLMCFWHAMALLFGFVQCANKRGLHEHTPHTEPPPCSPAQPHLPPTT